MRLYILVEGQTEDGFIKSVLAPHLYGFGFDTVTSTIVETSREVSGKKKKGGGYWKNWERDLWLLTRQQKSSRARFTTLFDLYGLPKDFPGLGQHGSDTDTVRRIERLEEAMAHEVGDWRFTPYIQRHEFEALVLAGLDELELLLDAEEDLEGLKKLQHEIRGKSPEDINDGETSAPSKRLGQYILGYEKTVHGPLATEGAGLPRLRGACPGLDRWVSRLEELGRRSRS